MVIKKSFLFGLLLAVSAGALSAQWRSDVAKLFHNDKDYKAIADYLEPVYATLESLIDKSDASGILAFCDGRRNLSAEERQWIVEFFEANGGNDTGFAFLDLVNQSDVLGWLNGWRGRYPQITEIALIKGVGDEPLMPQGVLPLVIDIRNEAYYKFALGAEVLEGGQLKPGFNVIALNANDLFLEPGTRVYSLEVKAAGLILRKEITLEVDVSTPRFSPPKTAPPPGRTAEYFLSIYIGGELVMSSRKEERPVSLKLGLQPGNLPYGFKPDYVLHRDEPNPMNSFSIVQAIGMIYSLLKDLLKKKNKKDVEPPKIQTVRDLTLTFKQKDEYNRNQESKVSIRLRTKNLPYVLSVP